MKTTSAIVFSGIAPHPPIMVPGVGGTASEDVRGSIEAMAEFSRRIIETGARTVLLISPHAPLDRHAFVAYPGPQLYGDFAKFRAPAIRINSELDRELLHAVAQAAAEKKYEVLTLHDEVSELDHGTAVPLYFLDRNGWTGQVVALGYSFLTNADHLSFGECIRRAIDVVGTPVAVVASGDLSHRLKPGAPAGYNTNAHIFDEQVVDAIRLNMPGRIIDIDQNLRRTAGECGYRSMLVALGATRGLPEACDVLHYEAPFGVGYLVAQLTNAKTAGLKPGSSSDVGETMDDAKEDLPGLARRAVETFVLTGKQIPAPPNVSGILSARAACFVTLKSKSDQTRTRDLRGCIGTVEPIMNTLAEELIANAIKAASRDPRFDPVSAEELPHLHYSVDVLAAPEPATFEELDPAIYGVIVEDKAGAYRGLLLPDIEGVDTAAKQVEIAARKAGIRRDSPLKFSRFRVERYGEK